MIILISELSTRMHKIFKINFTAKNKLKGKMLVLISMFTFCFSGSDLKLDCRTWLLRVFSATNSATDCNKSSPKKSYVSYLFINCIDQQ